MNYLNKQKKYSIFLVFIISLFMNNTYASNFNDSKLDLMCDFFSENKNQCHKEAIYIKAKNTSNSIINQCFIKYSSLKRFNDCLKYENNPLLFLNYQKNRSIPSTKIIEVKKEIVLNCNKIQDDGRRYSCIRESYLIIEKGSNIDNWIENYCLYSYDKIGIISQCINKIKSDAKNDNNLISSIPNLANSLNLWENKLNKRVYSYMNQVYAECESKYTDENAFECHDNNLKTNIKIMTNFEFSNAQCFKHEDYKDFSYCLSKFR